MVRAMILAHEPRQARVAGEAYVRFICLGAIMKKSIPIINRATYTKYVTSVERLTCTLKDYCNASLNEHGFIEVACGNGKRVIIDGGLLNKSQNITIIHFSDGDYLALFDEVVPCAAGNGVDFSCIKYNNKEYLQRIEITEIGYSNYLLHNSYFVNNIMKVKTNASRIKVILSLLLLLLIIGATIIAYFYPNIYYIKNIFLLGNFINNSFSLMIKIVVSIILVLYGLRFFCLADELKDTVIIKRNEIEKLISEIRDRT